MSSERGGSVLIVMGSARTAGNTSVAVERLPEKLGG